MDEILKLFGGTENIWAIIQENAPKVGIEATRIMLELFYVMKSPETGMINKSIIVAALGYQLLPEDILPREKFGLLGFLDNGITLAFAYNRVKSSVTPEIEQQVNSILRNWFGGERRSDKAQEWIPSGDRTSDNGGYSPRQVYTTHGQQPNNHTSLNDNFDRNNKPQSPSWNDDEDVVID